MIEYDKRNIPRAKELRKNMTPWERKLWYEYLRQYPVRFQRQKAIGEYIADFYCAKARLVIELDGGGLKADLTARLVYIDGQRIEMSPKEYDLFFYMLANRNIALSREKLICEVWGYDFYGDARTLDTHIKLLRKSLGKYSGYIVTLRGVGYRFEGV